MGDLAGRVALLGAALVLAAWWNRYVPRGRSDEPEPGLPSPKRILGVALALALSAAVVGALVQPRSALAYARRLIPARAAADLWRLLDAGWTWIIAFVRHSFLGARPEVRDVFTDGRPVDLARIDPGPARR